MATVIGSIAQPALPDDAPRPQKSQAAFRTISEVAEDLDVAQHVLRFWESKFPQVRPLKRGGGRRYYRPEDVEVLRRIRALLYDEGYTIKGAQKLLRAQRAARAGEEPRPTEPAREAVPRSPARALPQPVRRELDGVRRELVELRDRLRQALRRNDAA